ncbi:MAG: methyltransferase type 11 [Rhizobiales bacterium NRL2]|jgi:SAM-dependent methyltransferase|nr:MAG: methyltransferase type 11 [Rhizobiales bacterium NRL2]
MTPTVAEKPPAEIYDEKFVPALFGQWGPVIAGLAGIGAGHRVLDVACGTGALTLACAERAGDRGRVAGLDANPEMLEVARRKTDTVEWHEGMAEALPFESGSFDAVVSQFGMMFFDDRPRALREMARVLRPGGRLAVAVCGDVARSPGYAVFAGLLDRLFGRQVGDAFRAPFALGDRVLLGAIAGEAGLSGAAIEDHWGQVRFDSIEALVSTERACVWTLGGILDDAQFESLLAESARELAPFRGTDGRVAFDMPALILTWQKPAA